MNRVTAALLVVIAAAAQGAGRFPGLNMRQMQVIYVYP
jgi:hypothetical protein